MPWKELSADDLAKRFGLNISEVREKQRLMLLIVKVRKRLELSQAQLAKRIGVTQGRIAQIESGVGTARVTFDVLFNILNALGYEYKIVSRKAA